MWVLYGFNTFKKKYTTTLRPWFYKPDGLKWDYSFSLNGLPAPFCPKAGTWVVVWAWSHHTPQPGIVRPAQAGRPRGIGVTNWDVFMQDRRYFGIYSCNTGMYHGILKKMEINGISQ